MRRRIGRLVVSAVSALVFSECVRGLQTSHYHALPRCHTNEAVTHPLSSVHATATRHRFTRNKQSIYRHQHRIRHSPLLSSPESSLDKPDEGKSPKNKKWRNPILILRKILTRLINAIITSPAKFKSYFVKLSKKGRIILSLQFMVLGLLLGVGYKTSAQSRTARANRPVEVSYSTFLDLVDRNGKGHVPGQNPALKLEQVVISKDRVGFKVISDAEKHAKALMDKKLVKENDVSVQPIPTGQRRIYAVKPPASQELIDTLRQGEVPFRAASAKSANQMASLARLSIVVIYLLFLKKMYSAMGGGGAGGGSSGPGKLAAFNADEPLVKFEDIEGIDGAKFEVMELVDTLRNPKKYEILGARAPTGLLLEGPPGTGKTMLARATAATAGVPLLYCSGSDFVEMFVGRGAARVRSTFARAGKLAPCIIFIDELDALGKSRDMGGLGVNMRGNDEAEQTLNQLLACMDGLDSSRRVCVLAATNRREVLDPALIRPGRFDRIIKVTAPDVQGRERILRVHAGKLPGFSECSGVDEKRPGSLGKGSSVDLSAVAAVTRGLCGADLEFIVNEAAIRAVRRVSSKLRAGEDPSTITPTVAAEDFELSVVDFFVTRKPRGNVGDLFNILSK